MTGVPHSRAEWRTWIRTANPGEVRRRAGVRQEDLAERISSVSGTRVSAGSLSGWERGSTLPSVRAHRAAWFEAVTELATAQGKSR